MYREEVARERPNSWPLRREGKEWEGREGLGGRETREGGMWWRRGRKRGGGAREGGRGGSKRGDAYERSVSESTRRGKGGPENGSSAFICLWLWRLAYL